MKPFSLLLGGLLLASPGCPGAQVAVTPSKSKVARARGSKAAKTLRKVKVPQAAAMPTRGMALALSTSLRELPPEVAPPAPVSFAAYTPHAVASVKVVPDMKQAGMNANVPRPRVGSLFGSLGQAIPILPDGGQSILPGIRKVYPSGEKPLVVVSFNLQQVCQ